MPNYQTPGAYEAVDGVPSTVKGAGGEAGWCFGLYLREVRFESAPANTPPL
jgi:hypothetical protein